MTAGSPAVRGKSQEGVDGSREKAMVSTCVEQTDSKGVMYMSVKVSWGTLLNTTNCWVVEQSPSFGSSSEHSEEHVSRNADHNISERNRAKCQGTRHASAGVQGLNTNSSVHMTTLTGAQCHSTGAPRRITLQLAFRRLARVWFLQLGGRDALRVSVVQGASSHDPRGAEDFRLGGKQVPYHAHVENDGFGDHTL